ncbi:hypothetical protein [Sphingobacterium bambusae]|uniref:Uncharacterized protein n=2 Tax=Sphingobacterium bambusae TaxID=662858 RepID=A0ABW6BP97_9SPHI|nr:hypothetical protein [Sphingobacterium bambusae]WPL49847.1 hypothetical protein SCB77_05185 [Sphingobacterium bambusae]
MENNRFSYLVSIFQDRLMPEEGYLVGYAALIQAYGLHVPLPDVLSVISHKHRQYRNIEWQIFTPRHKPEDSLIGHLTFALKYEGIELYLLKELFTILDANDLAALMAEEPNG